MNTRRLALCVAVLSQVCLLVLFFLWSSIPLSKQLSSSKQTFEEQHEFTDIATTRYTKHESVAIPIYEGLHQNDSLAFSPDPRMPFGNLHEHNIAHSLPFDLFIAVLSSLKGVRRRNAIRETWMKLCRERPKVKCLFFTDAFNASQHDRALVDSAQRELAQFNDMVVMPIGSGIQFGLRLLFIFQYAMANYNASYIMRVDDDVMLCLDHLLDNLIDFPRDLVYWGWLHCDKLGAVFIDEGITMFSQDVVAEFLSQDANEMLCHPFGDQAVALWIQSIQFDEHSLYHPEQKRIHHSPPASKVAELRQRQAICDDYIALHGVYADDMEHFWQRRGLGTHYSRYENVLLSAVCRYPPLMQWFAFEGIFYHPPKRCITKPFWYVDNTVYEGRENRS